MSISARFTNLGEFQIPSGGQIIEGYVGLDKVVFYDSRYPSGWVTGTDILASNLNNYGFTTKNADQLQTWMQNYVTAGNAFGATCVIAHGIVPDTICATEDTNALIRKFLNVGGRIVWVGDWPFYNVGHNDGTLTSWGSAGMSDVLGFTEQSVADGTDTITSDGTTWGLTTTWSGQRPINGTPAITLATAASHSHGYVVYFDPTNSKGGFVRIHDTTMTYASGDAFSQDVAAVAQYHLSMFNSDGTILVGEIEESMPVPTASIAPTETTNMLVNSNFTNGLSNWVTWGSPVTLAVQTSNPFASKNDIHIVTNGSNQGISQSVNVTSGQQYAVSMWIKVISGTPTIMTINGNAYPGAQAPSTWAGDGQFHQLSFTYTPTVSTDTVYLGMNGLGAACEFYLGAVQFEKNSPSNFTPSSRPNNSLLLAKTLQENAQNGLVFDGSSGYVNCGTSSVFNLTQLTIEAVIITPQSMGTSGTSIFRGVLSKQGSDRDYNFYCYSSDGVSVTHLHQSSGRFGSILLPLPQSLAPNSTHHIAVTIDSTGFQTFYVDGQSVGTYQGTAGNANNSYPLWIGRADNYWDSTILQVRLWNIARSASDIAKNPFDLLKGTESGLIGYWDFHESFGSTVYDSTANSNNGTIVGGVTRTFV